MSLDKSIKHGKEHRKQYRGAKACSTRCRNHGSCDYCLRNRLHSSKKRLARINDLSKELEFAQCLQEKEKRLYLLTQGDDSCHDMDEWVGVFDNTSDLRKAYESTLSKGSNNQRCERLMIFEFENQPPHSRDFSRELGDISLYVLYMVYIVYRWNIHTYLKCKQKGGLRYADLYLI